MDKNGCPFCDGRCNLMQDLAAMIDIVLSVAGLENYAFGLVIFQKDDLHEATFIGNMEQGINIEVLRYIGDKLEERELAKELQNAQDIGPTMGNA